MAKGKKKKKWTEAELVSEFFARRERLVNALASQRKIEGEVNRARTELKQIADKAVDALNKTPAGKEARFGCIMHEAPGTRPQLVMMRKGCSMRLLGDPNEPPEVTAKLEGQYEPRDESCGERTESDGSDD